MSIVPNTTCRRCHRQYPSFRSKCPYCGTKKAKEVRSAVPETDSVTPGTKASKSAVESMNLQMLIVSVNIAKDVDTQTVLEDNQIADLQITPVPAPTATPEPTPTPPPAITQVQVVLGENGTQDYVDNGYTEGQGTELTFYVKWFPSDVAAIPEWYAEDEGIVELTPSESGQSCTIKSVGDPWTGTYVHVRVNEMDKKFQVLIKG